MILATGPARSRRNPPPIESSFDSQVDQADDLTSAMTKLEQQAADLILVNRKLDIDYSDGMAIVRRLKSDPRWASIPVMLVTNYPEYQAEAIAAVPSRASANRSSA